MKEILQISKNTFIVISVCALASHVTSALWNDYQKKQQEAEYQKSCEPLRAYRAEVLRRINEGTRVSDMELSSAYRVNAMCPESQ